MVLVSDMHSLLCVSSNVKCTSTTAACSQQLSIRWQGCRRNTSLIDVRTKCNDQPPGLPVSAPQVPSAHREGCCQPCWWCMIPAHSQQHPGWSCSLVCQGAQGSQCGSLASVMHALAAVHSSELNHTVALQTTGVKQGCRSEPTLARCEYVCCLLVPQCAHMLHCIP